MRTALTPFQPWFRLTRYREYVLPITLISLLGSRLAGAALEWRVLVVTLANLLVAAFAYMLNDVEDAIDDRLDPIKRERNPVAGGNISTERGRLACAVTAGIALLLYSLLGVAPVIFCIVNLVILFGYSSRSVRLKAHPIADLLSHGIGLGTIQFLSAYSVFDSDFSTVLPIIIIILLASMSGQLYNQLRDFAVDNRAQLETTTLLLGYGAAFTIFRLSQIALVGMLFYILWLETVPRWIMLLFFATSGAVVMVAPKKHSSSLEYFRNYHEPILIIANVSAVLCFTYA